MLVEMDRGRGPVHLTRSARGWDDMFFEIAKIGWALAMPAHVLLILILVGAVLLWTPWRAEVGC